MIAGCRLTSVLSIILAGVPPVFAADQPTDPATRHYAEAMKIGTYEAAQRMDAERAASKLNARLQIQKPDTFAGLYIEHSPEFKIVVKFTGNASAQLAAYTKDRLYTAETAPRSLELLRATQREVADQLTRAGIDYAISLDLESSMVDVFVRDPEMARAKIAKLLAAVDFIRLKETVGFIEPTSSVAGGRRLEGDQRQLCTAGFNVVETATRELGLATAGHCDNNNYQRNPNARIVFKGERSKDPMTFSGALSRGAAYYFPSQTRSSLTVRHCRLPTRHQFLTQLKESQSASTA